MVTSLKEDIKSLCLHSSYIDGKQNSLSCKVRLRDLGLKSTKNLEAREMWG